MANVCESETTVVNDSHPPRPESNTDHSDSDSDYMDDYQLSKREESESELEEEQKWSHIRYVYEDGELGEKPAAVFLIYLNASAPEGCDRETYHMGILQKVVNGATAALICSSRINDLALKAILTKDEHEKLCALDVVKDTDQLIYFGYHPREG